MTTSPALTAAPTSERTLRRVLAADALVGLVAAIALLAATELYARLTGLPTPVLRGVGLALVGYVVALAWASRARPLPRRAVGALVVANWAWVAASAVLLAMLPATPFGVVYVIGQAVVVAGFAVAEARGLARLPDSSAP
ncbi:hypothetical protein [Cellulomonas humilata]|uniref:Multisubunit Na+/H+ antiporter MnhG subunit n=1 Tax=Cellulomonas humilata TaxID=144055 RepID=A0ABU0EIU4_9CELL|nr:hypothetical protein [Cellulomonas humilata]MDQ0375208.1 multisubunit Na+/H+ antiporter MnhG subunit [Cellulomonas humilata]